MYIEPMAMIILTVWFILMMVWIVYDRKRSIRNWKSVNKDGKLVVHKTSCYYK